MFVGHAMLAFGLLAGVAALRGRHEGALALGVAAAAFAAVPDVDILYAPVGLAQVGATSLPAAVEAFWTTGNVVHRSVTHSLVVGAPASAAFALAATRRGRPVAVAVIAALAGWVGLVDGALAAAAMAAFGLAGAAVAVVVHRRLGLTPRAVFAAAAVGVLTHPFGDLFTGEPPPLAYPLDATLVGARVPLHPDPTLHLLAAFGLELATVWLAAAVYCRLRGVALGRLVDRRAAVGVAYGAAALVLPAPTLEAAYHFVFSVLAVGFVGIARRAPLLDPHARARAAATGLAAVTLAGAAYAAAYVLVSVL